MQTPSCALVNMAETIVSITIESLWGLLRDETKILSGVSDQVDELCREFKRMQCFLQDAEARQHKEQSVRNWIQEIKNLAYRAQDIIETYAVEVSSSKGMGFKKPCKRYACIQAEARSLHKISGEIGNIKVEIARLTTSFEAHGIKAISSQGESSSSRAAIDEKERWLRKTYLHEDEEAFVERKDDIEKLLSFLLDEDGSHPIVSIWGMGGSGKTTIARKIYNDAQIRRHFNAFAWIFISPHCQVRKVLEEILLQIFGDQAKMKREVKDMPDWELVEELYKKQMEKKCLVVLDDIWNVDDWKCLKPALPSRVSRSKILLTTRKTEIAEFGRIHKLNYMNENDAWELLQKKSLIQARSNLTDLKVEAEREKIGRELVRRCGCLPLAISVLGGVLRKKESVDEWMVVNEKLRQQGLEEGNTSTSTEGVMQILSLSYDDLPPHLKMCFLSLGLFSGYDIIGVGELCSLWLAEGIVSSKNLGKGENTFEEAVECVSELASRSMVEVERSSYITLRFESCKLHDLMRDLCLAKCRAEDFVKVVDFQGRKELPRLTSDSYPTSSRDTEACRLAIYTRDQYIDCNNFPAIGNISEVRFLVASNVGQARVEITLSREILVNKFKCLRFLRIDNYCFRDKKLIQVIVKLIHLRGLIFVSCYVDELPLEILNLPYLRTAFLDLDFGDPSKTPNPYTGWKAKRLRYLHFPDTSDKLVVGGKLRLRGLFQLEGLYFFCTDTMKATDLCYLRNLREFSAKISGNDNLSLILSCIGIHWPNIQSVGLIISGCEFITTKSRESEPSGGDLLSRVLTCRPIFALEIVGKLSNRLPKYEPRLGSSLIRLRLDQSKILEDPMETLENFPNLKVLALGEDSFVGRKLVCHAMGFPSLEELELKRLKNLKWWRVENGAMPNLQRLEIVGCKELVFPNGLKFNSARMEIKVVDMPKEFNDRINMPDFQSGSDYDLPSPEP